MAGRRVSNPTHRARGTAGGRYAVSERLLMRIAEPEAGPESANGTIEAMREELDVLKKASATFAAELAQR